ncbi:MAG: GAF domain-containing protein [Chloroflexota bacterium]
MMRQLRAFFRPTIRYSNPLTQQRAQGLLIYLGLGFVLSALGSIAPLIEAITLFAQTGTLRVDAIGVVTILSPILSIVFFALVRQGFYEQAVFGILTLSLMALIPLSEDPLRSVNVLTFIIPIIMAGVLAGWQTTSIITVIVLGFAARPTLLDRLGPSPETDFVVFVLFAFLFASLMIIFGTNVRSTAVRFIRDFQNLIQITDNLVVTREATTENEAIRTALNTVRDQVHFTFARVYLVDDGLVTQRLQPGLNQSQLNVDTRIDLTSRSAVYEAIRQNDIVLVRGSDDNSFRQHILSGTQQALLVPFSNRNGEVVGVLDAESEDRVQFSESDQQTLRLIAQQLGQTLERIQVVDSLRKDLQEQDELIAKQRDQLLQYERLERQTTIETWRSYLEQRNTEFLGFDMTGQYTPPVEAVDLDEDLQTAIEAGTIVVTEQDRYQHVKVPIQYRGQTLGAMTFRVPLAAQTIGARQQDLIRNVVQRLSLALENKRLFEQSRAQAKRERKANEVGSLLLGTTDIETVLELAASNFQSALGAVQTQIRLEPLADNISKNGDEDSV